MGLVVPEACISTVDAYSQMLKADSEWRRCSEGWEAAGSLLPILAAPTIAEISERQEALAAELHKAVVAGEIALFAYTRRELLRVYPDDPRTETELRIAGKIRAGKVDTPERLEMDGAPLCFRQADWCAWLAARSSTALATVGAATEQPTEPKAERPKVVRRTAGAKPTKRETVKDYLQKTYPDGVPAGVKNESIASLHGVHERTVRRALREMGQNTDR
jgi:hypothetical protein